ncbi:hypothetical protein [Marinobacter sp. AN1]|uniref:hypothetical protein n=1 Tax=Marinobacter sp. AN1 TaxID=2886046 RepID=UPI00223248E9|nr:hypothetical protein [Marinobacter sp. AN1]UZD67069.1 hypothetical protein LJ360_07060 [Marinobacter sp. AN1]
MEQTDRPRESGVKGWLAAAASGFGRVMGVAWQRGILIPAFLAFALLLAAVGALCEDRDNIFTVEATTETLSLVTSDEVFSQWFVGGGRLMTDPLASSDDSVLLPADTYLNISRGTEVTVQRHGIQALRIKLQNPSGPLGTLNSVEPLETTLGSWAVVIFEPELTPLILPFRGVLTVGDDVTSQVDSILLSGSISVLEQQWIRNTRYVAGNTTLDPGDRIRFWDESDGNGPKQAVVEGFIRVEPTNQERFTEALNAMQLIAHGAASYVQVQRLGSTGYQVYAHRWARFLYDPLLASLAALGAVLFAALEIYSKSREIGIHLRERRDG